MKSIYREPNQPATTVPRLALRPREAALQLGLSEKGLFNITVPRGNLPAVKVGARTCYFVHQLQAWADSELARQQAAQQTGAESDGVA